MDSHVNNFIGAGEANFDALEVNPYETKAQRRENVPTALLNKLQPSMIALDPDFVGRIDTASEDVKRIERGEDKKQVSSTLSPMLQEATNSQLTLSDVQPDEIALKNKARGKNTAMKKYLRKVKKRNIVDDKRVRYEQIKEDKRRERAGVPTEAEKFGPALARFTRPQKV